MSITAETKIGEIAAQYPLTTRVFSRHGIDFCCGGGVPLQQACDRRGLVTGQILDEIEQVLAASEPDPQQWNEAPVAELVRHIVDAYHLPLREELPWLEAMARKVVRVHGDRDPERFGELLQTFLGLKAELEDHMAREENDLFPKILSHEGAASGTIDPLLDDHTKAGQALARLRELTGGYRVPDGACNTWCALWQGLEALEQSLHHHIHLENNVLFPRLSAA